MKVRNWNNDEIHHFLWLIECFVMRTMVAGAKGVGGDLYALMKFAKMVYLGADKEEIFDELREHLTNKGNGKNPEGWSSLETTNLKDKSAFVLLHAIDRNPSRDPGPRTQGLHARQLLPKFSYIASQNGWVYTQKERFNEGYHSSKIGNWFLLNGVGSEIDMYKEVSPYVKISNWKDFGVASTLSDLEYIDDSWEGANITDRTREIIDNCNHLYPDDYMNPKKK